MKHLKYLAGMAAAAALLAAGRAAAAEPEPPGAPVRLSEAELDQVTAGEGTLLDLDVNVLLQDIDILVNVSNVPVNAGAVVQANALGTSAQTATVQALQEVTQVQTWNQ